MDVQNKEDIREKDCENIELDDKQPTDEDNKQKDANRPEPGVIYLSKIPRKMNVKIIREYFSQFGEVDRIYLEPQEKKRKSKVLRTFAEGWVEFKNKRIAKAVAKRYNNKPVGGKRSNPWYDELWNIKYLKKFRWTHLNERKTYENEVRKQRLRQEVALAKKESSYYMQNVEKSQKLKRLEKKKQAKNDESSLQKNEIERNIVIPQKTSVDDKNETEKNVNKRPKFERKVKITGNDDFLKQIFSK